MVLFDRDAALLEKRIAAISISCFALISNIIRNTLGDFMWKCRWTFFEPNVHLHFHLKSHGVVF